MKKILFILSIFISTSDFGQTSCVSSLHIDSCALQNASNKELVEVIEVKIKNDYQIQFIKHISKNYLKIIVKDNLGYGLKSSLLLESNKKQIYIKTIPLQVINKTSAYFLIELNTNYLQNIKEFGLSKIIFNEKAEFGIPKSDADQIKKAANCFFNQITENIKSPSK